MRHSLSPAFAVAAPSVAPKRAAGLRVSCLLEGRANAAAEKAAALRSFHEKRAFKVIAGLQNFNQESVKSIISAAQVGGATLVDIACDPELVRLSLGLTSLPVCVSAVDPEAFLPAVEAGAHMIEIGNFDSFYSTGRNFSAEEVLSITKRTRELLPHIALSVTVPHTLSVTEQVELAEALQAAGADIIQTEGGTSSAPQSAGVLGLVQKATPTLAAAYSISRAVSIPVLCASGLSAVTVPLAFAAGASGVGVGSAINKLQSPFEMVAAVRTVAEAVAARSAASTEAAVPLS